MRKQAELWARLVHQGQGILSLERILPIDGILNSCLRVLGLYENGNRNFRDLGLVENHVSHANLPLPFEGYRILQMSDLHLDLDTSLTPAIIEVLRKADCDLAVITGDFRNTTTDYHGEALRQLERIMEHLPMPVYSVLGNHDFIEMVPELEAMGLRILLNENVVLQRKDSTIHLAGVDDPTFYETHDLKAAGRNRANREFAILLSHGPKIYRDAEGADFDLMLCGHTHGGQICLPGGWIVVRNGECPLRMISGAWRYRKLSGYTSRGTGCTGIAIRFNCPPEITVHVLHAKSVGS